MDVSRINPHTSAVVKPAPMAARPFLDLLQSKLQDTMLEQIAAFKTEVTQVRAIALFHLEFGATATSYLAKALDSRPCASQSNIWWHL